MYHVRPEDRLDDIIFTPKNQAEKEIGLETEEDLQAKDLSSLKNDTNTTIEQEDF